MEYTTQLIIESKLKLDQLPKTPFFVRNTRQHNPVTYMITKFSGKFIVTCIETGESYDNDYRENTILDTINEGSWKLVGSEIIIK